MIVLIDMNICTLTISSDIEDARLDKIHIDVW